MDHAKLLRFLLALLLAVCSLISTDFSHAQSQEAASPKTFCNPLNLDYFIQPSLPVRREAADPLALVFEGDYYIFASKSNGYWWSPDFSHWTHITPSVLPLAAYAPGVFEYKNALYFMASGNGGLYKSDSPKQPNSWSRVGNVRKDTDPNLFLDDDGKVYLTYGCHLGGPISIVQLDPDNHFKEIGKPVNVIYSNSKEHGWERGGEDNTGSQTWVEGSWLTKHNGHYYLQYSAPGTQWKTYGDGVYTADHIMGPYSYADYNPFSYKPTGFIGGAGHSGTFQDKSGNWWRISTGTISVAQRFERRLVVFPAGFDAQDHFFTRTVFGDFPQYLPGQHQHPEKDNSPGWSILTWHKPVKASSSKTGHPPENAVDENIRTWWSAASKNPGEWLEVDLGTGRTVNAIQVNFAEEDVTTLGANPGFSQKYKIECSDDEKTWNLLIDKSANTQDVPHDYIELNHGVATRYLRITNIATPGNGTFSLRGFRAFGNAIGNPPPAVSGLKVVRDESDRCHATVQWNAAPGATGYIVHYGVAPDALYNQYEVRDATQLIIPSLNAPVSYWFTVDALNESGVTPAAAGSAIEAK